ncbi:RHS repeat-associated core domain-containing protein, partial [Chitinophaga sp. 30R24]|uniref:RHS repeat-associated core domain-containing protein n=1 Tax=Chitinophaga sp. 30R24 TaxID=3248838 RepID=UPI003B8FC03F
DQSETFNTNFYNDEYQQLKAKAPNAGQPDRPKAYLNFVLFDDQFKLVEENSGVKQVQATPDQLQLLSQEKMVMRKSGFLYVYTSNESKREVYFDDVVLGVHSGPMLEETHYYPFGLTMAGISSNALKGSNYPENRNKFNGIEHTTDLDLNEYDAFYRNLDPQLGRWWQIDPKAIEAESPYAAMRNNPVLNTDFLGDTTVYYNISNGSVLGTVNNAGSPQNVRVDALAYIAAQGAALVGGYDLSNQDNANQFVSTFNSALSTIDSKLGTNFISFATGEMKLEFVGQANANNPAQGDGTLNVNQMFDDGGHLTVASYQAIGGPWGNGSPENGTYTADHLADRGPKSSWPNDGMTRDGVGFSLNLNPQFSTHRSLLRIHPDGGKAVGTQGCIGLQVNATQLLQFKSTMREYLSTHNNIGVNVNILNNPNNNGRNSRAVSNGE